MKVAMNPDQPLVVAFHSPAPTRAQRLDLLESLTRRAFHVLRVAIDRAEDALAAAE